MPYDEGLHYTLKWAANGSGELNTTARTYLPNFGDCWSTFRPDRRGVSFWLGLSRVPEIFAAGFARGFPAGVRGCKFLVA
jgi:hypothetical protein